MVANSSNEDFDDKFNSNAAVLRTDHTSANKRL
jgi:hypothetical protein